MSYWNYVDHYALPIFQVVMSTQSTKNFFVFLYIQQYTRKHQPTCTKVQNTQVSFVMLFIFILNCSTHHHCHSHPLQQQEYKGTTNPLTLTQRMLLTTPYIQCKVFVYLMLYLKIWLNNCITSIWNTELWVKLGEGIGEWVEVRAAVGAGRQAIIFVLIKWCCKRMKQYLSE